MERILVRIIQNIIIEWECIKCHKINQVTVYTKIDGIALQCDKCKKIFTGYMILGK